ncbi:MAG: thioredoxin family protein [Thermoguttaceae bacterium]
MTTMLCAAIVQTALLLTGADADAAKSDTAKSQAAKTESAEADVSKAETYTEAHRIAEKTGKPIVVLVSTNWCAPCQTMKRHILPRVREHGALRRVAFAVVNPDEDSELAEQLTGGGPIPQLVMYHKTADGWVRQKLVGGQTEEAVEDFIKEGLASDASEKKPEATKLPEKPSSEHATANRTDAGSDESATRRS